MWKLLNPRFRGLTVFSFGLVGMVGDGIRSLRSRQGRRLEGLAHP